MSLLEVKELRKSYPVRKGFWRKLVGEVQAVDKVSFSIDPGETFGLVGESGSGKSTLGLSLLRLVEPTSGSVQFEGEEVTTMSSEELRRWRKKAQMVFQDPFGSLNPRMRVRSIIGEAFVIHRLVPRDEIPSRVEALLETVGLGPDAMGKFPHEFSGGQRQRIGIARALAAGPKFIVADEPVSALDVSIQAQILNLLLDLQEKLRLSYLFISHDLRAVEFIAKRVAVMYLGRFMEVLGASNLSKQAKHPYTQALLAAVPIADPTKKRARIVLGGEIPNPLHPPSGCVFHTRCPIAEEKCKREIPPLREIEKDHWAACHLV